ncbi:hypothetical protein BGZ74_004229 [Mortierella antarctica]|nr:hypothetical protein BGZ74_004229 [Mortierella antarctica]
MAAAGAAANQDVEEGGLILPPPEPITETSMVVATFGVAAEKQEAPKHAKEPSSESTGLYEEPPKKKMRSTAAILLGAAVETVILTSAVALSAYHLLTGKGKDQPKEETTEVVEEPKPQEPEKPVLQIQSAPVNIPRGLRHKSSGSPRPHHMAHSYHHTSHHYKKSKNKSNVAVLSSSLPHAQTHRFGDREALPGRPDTGTEDNDEQFLRMEAQLTTLIAEGKRALSSRIESWDEMSEASARR